MIRKNLKISEANKENKDRNTFKIRCCNYLLVASLVVLASWRVFLMVWSPQLFSKNVTNEIVKCAVEATGKVESVEKNGFFKFPPHLMANAATLTPAYRRSKGRSGVSIVLGVATVRRQRITHLRATLNTLLNNMSEEERENTLIVVYIGETNANDLQLIVHKIETSFMAHVESGLIDIVAPAISYYPGTEEPLQWHSKENLDVAYLMTYACSRGFFYVHLADDILAKRGFITSMRKFALIKMAFNYSNQPKWFVLDFCPDGFVGKLFKCAELPYLITYLQIFYNDMAPRQLLSYFIETTLCRRHCTVEKSIYWQRYHESQFQRIGNLTLRKKLQLLSSMDVSIGQPLVTNPPDIKINKSNFAKVY